METRANVQVGSIHSERAAFGPPVEFSVDWADDIVNVSEGRRMAAEIESSLSSYEAVAESTVVDFSHELKGWGICAFVTLKKGFNPSEGLKKYLIAHVRNEIGPGGAPDKIHFTPALPKTRSGKIMKRILRTIVEGKTDELGDISKLDDPIAVKDLVRSMAGLPPGDNSFWEWF